VKLRRLISAVTSTLCYEIRCDVAPISLIPRTNARIASAIGRSCSTRLQDRTDHLRRATLGKQDLYKSTVVGVDDEGCTKLTCARAIRTRHVLPRLLRRVSFSCEGCKLHGPCFCVVEHPDSFLCLLPVVVFRDLSRRKPLRCELTVNPKPELLHILRRLHSLHAALFNMMPVEQLVIDSLCERCVCSAC